MKVSPVRAKIDTRVSHVLPHARLALAILGLLLSPLAGSAAEKSTSTNPAAGTAPETRASRALDQARKQGTPALRAFLYTMPKGTDLHVHLSGAVYAESFLRAAGQDDLCVNPKTLSFVRSSVASQGCADGAVAAATVPKNQHLY